MAEGEQAGRYDKFLHLLERIEGYLPGADDAIEITDQLKIMALLAVDSRVNLKVKLFVPVAVATGMLACFKYGDVIPDWVPVLGKLDKAALAGGLLYMGNVIFTLVSPEEAVKEATAKVLETTQKKASPAGPVKKESGKKRGRGWND